MRYNDMPVMEKELIEFKKKVRVGDKVVVMRSDDVFERKKVKQKLTIIKKYRNFVLCQNKKSGTLETFKYIQLLLGDEAWLA